MQAKSRCEWMGRWLDSGGMGGEQMYQNMQAKSRCEWAGRWLDSGGMGGE